MGHPRFSLSTVALLYLRVRWVLHYEFQQVAGDAGSIVAGYAGFFQIISEHRDHAQGFNLIEIVDDLAGALAGVLGLQFV